MCAMEWDNAPQSSIQFHLFEFVAVCIRSECKLVMYVQVCVLLLVVEVGRSKWYQYFIFCWNVYSRMMITAIEKGRSVKTMYVTVCGRIRFRKLKLLHGDMSSVTKFIAVVFDSTKDEHEHVSRTHLIQ